MPAISEQATIDAGTSSVTVPPGTLPSTQYDLDKKQIYASVIISKSVDGDGYDILVPGILVPGPLGASWTVNWLLQTTIVDFQATLQSVTIEPIASDPLDGVIISLSLNLQQVTITNNLPEVGNVTAFNYVLTIVDGNGNPLPPSKRTQRIDPTISVVQEPMG